LLIDSICNQTATCLQRGAKNTNTVNMSQKDVKYFKSKVYGMTAVQQLGN